MTDCKLFEGLSNETLEKLIPQCGGRRRRYGSGQIILEQGEMTTRLGIVEEGSAVAVRYCADGTVVHTARLEKGAVFADFLAAESNKCSPVQVSAEEKGCKVLYIPVEQLFMPKRDCEADIRKIASNLAAIYADKYFELMDRLHCLTAPSLREKILRYLEMHAEKAKSESFTLPHTREQTAAFLNADRSAVSRELSRMKKDGLILIKGKKISLPHLNR